MNLEFQKTSLLITPREKLINLLSSEPSLLEKDAQNCSSEKVIEKSFSAKISVFYAKNHKVKCLFSRGQRGAWNKHFSNLIKEFSVGVKSKVKNFLKDSFC